MSSIDFHALKKRLDDPVSAYLAQHDDIDETTKLTLQQLSEKIKLLRDQHKNAQDKSKIISRQIGEAKKNNQSTDELMQQMQVHSRNTKLLAEQCTQIENEILSFFNPDEDSPRPDLSKTQPTTRTSDASIDIGDITIRQLTHQHDAWNAYVNTQHAANIHYRTEWIEVYLKTYGLTCHYFLAEDSNSQCVGILPLVRLNSRLFGNMLVSMPYFQRGGAIANSPDIENKLVEVANNYAASLGIEHIEYRDDIPRDNMPSLSHKANMVLALPDSQNELWNNFSPKLRAQIKRPQQVSPRITFGGKELLDDFYAVYSRNMRDLGSPAHSKQLVNNILGYFPENSWLVVIHHNNKPVSAALLLGFGKTLEIPLASTLRSVNPLSINMLLYWEVLQFAISKNYAFFDFGRSSKDAGTYRFKQQWGAQAKQLHWHYWLAQGEDMPSLNPSNPKYKLVIAIWKRLPVFITQWLGPLLVKNIP